MQVNEIMLSFDVELFNNVLIEDAIQTDSRKLENDPGLADRTTLTPKQIANLFSFVPIQFIHFTNNKTDQPWGA